ncbi:hypothetical protein W02_15920 [Nitrospira sp. KM1]|uniref:SGNH/GDSL hydrolase family protein n=1 Tax=Nitrospira sp. KM1 TaxID=1936990 RepID=UPI0013A77D85|nr:SGNH/GDSL hydrolase family protein [Nitrospira sp. KM1]BCA54452.1 hypothetical protein W02_15920 [Nitrospira sp. KM1]
MIGRGQSILALNVLLVIIGTSAGAVVSEMIARTFLSPPAGYSLYSREKDVAHASLAGMVSDPRLLVRLSSGAPGHDERGFRNRQGANAADVVAIGDSQTWGVNVPQDETWPAGLEQLTGLTVYSMSLGGWGPLQYERLAEDALELNPRAILVGFYLGNDIFDSCNHVYGSGSYPEYRRTDRDYAVSLSDLHARLETANGRERVDRAHEWQAGLGNQARLWQGLARHSLVIQILMTRGLLPSIPSVDALYKTADMAWAEMHPEVAAVYYGGGHSTVLTFAYRGVALDLRNACVQDGLRITKDVMSELAALRRTGTDVGMLLIPTKENVYAAANPSLRTRLNKGFAELFEMEQSVKADLSDHCTVLKLVCIDVSPRMTEAIRQEKVLYREDSDGHPIAEGYRVIALAAREALEDMRLEFRNLSEEGR